MKKSGSITSIVLLFLLAGCSDTPSIEELRLFAATESYPNDTYLDTVSTKRALILVAHDDDDCAMSGTIAKLTAKGWTIEQLAFVSHQMEDGSGENPASIICAGNDKILDDGIYRLGLDTMKFSYLPIPFEEMEKQFLREKITQALLTKIHAFKPTVIFSLDNIKGGYGHPEHIFLSQLLVDLFIENKIQAERIYQPVYTDHMEKEIVDKWLAARLKRWGYPHTSDLANELYGIDGMPEPDVQVIISDYADTKMKYLRAYPERARKNLRKFIPYYEEFDAQTYFSIFDREFFRVIQRES